MRRLPSALRAHPEIFRSADRRLLKCGKGPVRKLFSSPAIQFKGSGFYITDYARKSSTESGKSGGDSVSILDILQHERPTRIVGDGRQAERHNRRQGREEVRRRPRAQRLRRRLVQIERLQVFAERLGKIGRRSAK